MELFMEIPIDAFIFNSNKHECESLEETWDMTYNSDDIFNAEEIPIKQEVNIKQETIKPKYRCLLHNKYKYTCKECGKNRCIHGNRKSRCDKCGTGVCIHKVFKSNCIKCGRLKCIHNIRRRNCPEQECHSNIKIK